MGARVSKFLRSKMFTLVVLFVLIVILFTVGTNGSFLRPRNIVRIIDSMSVVALLTVAAACLLISGQLDLSCGAVGGLAALITAKILADTGLPLIAALIISLIVAAAFGMLNAALINDLGFPGFITTLAVSSVAEGAGMILIKVNAIKVTDSVLVFIGTGKVFENIPVSIFLAVAVFIIYGVMLKKTKFGRSIYLMGGSPQAARLAGLNPRKISYILFVNSSLIGALAGLLLAGRLKSAMTQALSGSQFAGVTAAILGGVSFGGGSGSLSGAFLGLLILSAFSNGITLIPGIDTDWQTVASGALLLIALLFDYISLRSRTRKRSGLKRGM